MPLIDELEKDLADITEEEKEEKKLGSYEENEEIKEPKAEEISSYLYLVDLISSMNNFSIQAKVVDSLLSNPDLPSSIEKVFDLFPEKDQFIQTLRVCIEKLELIRAAAEGALMAVATLEFTERIAKEK